LPDRVNLNGNVHCEAAIASLLVYPPPPTGDINPAAFDLVCSPCFSARSPFFKQLNRIIGTRSVYPSFVALFVGRFLTSSPLNLKIPATDSAFEVAILCFILCDFHPGFRPK
jgi:hypothetical protein